MKMRQGESEGTHSLWSRSQNHKPPALRFRALSTRVAHSGWSWSEPKLAFRGFREGVRLLKNSLGVRFYPRSGTKHTGFGTFQRASPSSTTTKGLSSLTRGA